MKKNDVLLSICIVSYNTRILTAAAVASAAADCERSELLRNASEILLVDNNSSDDSVSELKAQAKTLSIPIQIIENKKNTGFAKANNQALAVANGQYFLLLNSDTELQAGALEKLVLGMRLFKPQTTAALASARGKLDNIGIVAARLLNPDGSPQPQGGSFPTLLSVGCQMLFLDDLPIIGKFLPSTQHTGMRSTSEKSDQILLPRDWVAGTALMISRECYQEIGPLDEQIFMYGEDVEWCMRACDKHWDVAINTQAEVIHYGTASGTSKNALLGEFKGYIYIWAKHKPLWQSAWLLRLLKLGALLRVIVFATMNRRERSVVYLEIFRSLTTPS